MSVTEDYIGERDLTEIEAEAVADVETAYQILEVAETAFEVIEDLADIVLSPQNTSDTLTLQLTEREVALVQAAVRAYADGLSETKYGEIVTETAGTLLLLIDDSVEVQKL